MSEREREKGPEKRVRLTLRVRVWNCMNVEWLWAGRVPLGMITMFAGDPKLGKSFVTLAMAAALSRGQTVADERRPQPARQHDPDERRG